MEPKKKAIARLADAIYQVRAKPSDPFDADLAFGLVCAWTVLLLMNHLKSGASRFIGDIDITKRAKFATLLQDFPGSDFADKKARDAAAELLRTMALNTPFKNVLAKARMHLIKRRGVKIKSDWCRHDNDHALLKALCASQMTASGRLVIQMCGPAGGAMGLEVMAMVSEVVQERDERFEISVNCEDPTSLLVAIVQLMFASLLHAYAAVELRFYHLGNGSAEQVLEFTYDPPKWEREIQVAA